MKKENLLSVKHLLCNYCLSWSKGITTVVSLFISLLFVFSLVSCNNDTVENLPEPENVKTGKFEIDPVVYGRLVKDSVFLKLCKHYVGLEMEVFKEPDIEKNKKHLDYLRFVIRKYADKNNCENLVRYIRYYDESQSLSSRCVWCSVTSLSEVYYEHWDRAWTFYCDIFYDNLFNKVDYWCINAIDQEIYHWLLSKPLKSSIIFQGKRDEADDDAWALLNYSCSDIRIYCMTLGIYYSKDSQGNVTYDEISPNLSELYRGLYEYYLSEEWSKFVEPTDLCSICGNTPCICNYSCWVCGSYPCTCFVEPYRCTTCKDLNIWDMGEYEYKVLSDFRNSFYDLKTIASPIFNYNDDKSSYWSGEILNGGGYIINYTMDTPFTDRICNEIPSFFIYSDYPVDFYSRNAYIHNHDMDQHLVGLNIDDLITFDIANIDYGFSCSIINSCAHFCVLATSSTDRMKIDKTREELYDIYDEEFAKVAKSKINYLDQTLFAMAGLLKRVCPEIKVLKYGINNNNSEYLALYDVVAAGKYDSVNHTNHYCLIRGFE